MRLNALLCGCSHESTPDASAPIVDSGIIEDVSSDVPVFYVDAGICGLCPEDQRCGYDSTKGCDAAPTCVSFYVNCSGIGGGPKVGCDCDGGRVKWGCLAPGFAEKPLRGDLGCWMNPDAAE